MSVYRCLRMLDGLFSTHCHFLRFIFVNWSKKFAKTRIHNNSFSSLLKNWRNKFRVFVSGKHFQPNLIQHFSLLNPFKSYYENEMM